MVDSDHRLQVAKNERLRCFLSVLFLAFCPGGVSRKPTLGSKMSCPAPSYILEEICLSPANRDGHYECIEAASSSYQLIPGFPYSLFLVSICPLKNIRLAMVNAGNCKEVRQLHHYQLECGIGSGTDGHGAGNRCPGTALPEILASYLRISAAARL